MKIVIDADDFSPRNSGLGLLEELKEHYKNFKITLFTVPWDIRWGDPTPITDEKYRPFVNAIKKSEKWMEIALHGLTHYPLEFEKISYKEASNRIKVAEKMLQNQGVKYVKIFKAPNWEITKEGERAAKDLGFRVVKDGYYNWNLKDNMPLGDYLIAHGHIQNVMGNGLEEAMPKLMRLPTSTEFLFLSEHLNEK